MPALRFGMNVQPVRLIGGGNLVQRTFVRAVAADGAQVYRFRKFYCKCKYAPVFGLAVNLFAVAV